jgi:hypothetical protein
MDLKKFHRIWCKSLGNKITTNDIEADIACWLRTFVLLIYLITNIFIIAGVIVHFND